MEQMIMCLTSKKTKGSVDSGFNVAAAVGALAALRYDSYAIIEQREMFADRLQFVYDALKNAGLIPVGEPKSTFFSTWVIPNRAFGVDIVDC